MIPCSLTLEPLGVTVPVPGKGDTAWKGCPRHPGESAVLGRQAAPLGGSKELGLEVGEAQGRGTEQTYL